MPGNGAPVPEESKPRPGDKDEHISNVSQPMLTVYHAPANNSPAPAALICPGGGYAGLAYYKEGTEIAAWLNSLGITGVVLKYRVPGNREGAYQDIQRAMRLTRSHAAEWNIDPKRLGVVGFSAGGHLSARLSTGSDTPAYPAIDGADAVSCRPDFVVLVYPAYLGNKDGHVAPELKISPTLPPTLIVQTEDDTSFVAGTKAYHAALDDAKVRNRFLLYQIGGHGYGLRSTQEVHVWPEATKDWLMAIGILMGHP